MPLNSVGDTNQWFLSTWAAWVQRVYSSPLCILETSQSAWLALSILVELNLINLDIQPGRWSCESRKISTMEFSHCMGPSPCQNNITFLKYCSIQPPSHNMPRYVWELLELWTSETYILGAGIMHDSVAKSTWWSCRGPSFGSQHPHSDTQPTLIPVPGVWCPLLTSMDTRHTHGTQTHISSKHSHSKIRMNKP